MYYINLNWSILAEQIIKWSTNNWNLLTFDNKMYFVFLIDENRKY